jgi:hypothetical protein
MTTLRLDEITVSMPADMFASATAGLAGTGLVSGRKGTDAAVLWVGETCLRLRRHPDEGIAVRINLGCDTLDDIAERFSARDLPIFRDRPQQTYLFGLLRRPGDSEVLSPGPLPGTNTQICAVARDGGLPPSPSKPNAADSGILAVRCVDIGVPDIGSVFLTARALIGPRLQVQGSRLEMALDESVVALVAGYSGVAITLETTTMAQVRPVLPLAPGLELRILPA